MDLDRKPNLSESNLRICMSILDNIENDDGSNSSYEPDTTTCVPPPFLGDASVKF